MLDSVTDVTFHDRVRERIGPTVILFTGSWCQPCKKMYPIMEDLSKSFLGEVAFYTADVEETDQFASELGIRSVPSVALFSEGMVQDILSGTQTKNELRLWINENL